MVLTKRRIGNLDRGKPPGSHDLGGMVCLTLTQVGTDRGGLTADLGVIQ
jgi:hypothetical protein